ncbi:hypothetical protein BH11BAC5_BH11BAC5_19770 [soil metagenome]
MNNKFTLSLKSLMAFCLTLLSLVAFGQKTASTGNWNTPGTWSPSGVPTSADAVIIPNGIVLTGDVTTTCAAITFTGAAATLTVNAGVTVTVSGAINLNSAAAGNTTASITGAGSIACNSVGVGSAITPTTTSASTLTSTITSFSCSNNFVIQGTSVGNGGNSKQNNGVVNITSGLLTVNGTLSTTSTVSGNRTPSNSFTLGALNPTLRLGGATPFSIGPNGTVTLNATGATVDYSGGAQTVQGLAYPNLTFSGSGVKTAGGAITVAGNLAITNTSTFATASTFTLSVSGTTVIDGTLTAGGTGAKTFTGNVTVNSGGVWNETGVAAIGYAGNLQNDGTYTAATGIHTFSGATKTIGGNNAITIPNVTITGTVTNNGTLTASTTLAGAGTLTNSALGNLSFGGSSIAPVLIATAAGNTVRYTAAGAQTVKATTYSNLVLAGSGAKSISSATIAVAGNFSVVTGALANIGNGLTINAGSLTLGGLNKIGGTWGSTLSSATHTDNTYFAATTGILNVAGDTRPTPVFTGLNATPSITYGTASITLSGSVSATGPIYASQGEVIGVTINGVTQTTVIAGSVGAFSVNFSTASIPVTGSPYTITYTYGGDNSLQPTADDISTALTVSPSVLTITANDVSKPFGTTLTGGSGSTAFSASGLQNGESAGTVTIAYGAGAGATDAAGTYTGSVTPSVLTGGTLNAANYSVTYVPGNIIVTTSIASTDFRSKQAGNFTSAASWEYDLGGGTWADAIQPPSGTNNITITHAIILDQPFTMGSGKTLLINAGGSLEINAGITLSVQNSGTLDFNSQPVIVRSNAAGTGSIGVIAGTLSGATNVTVERFIATNKRAWRLLTIPVTGPTIRQAWCGVNANPTAPDGEVANAGTLITGNGYIDGTTAASNGFDWFTGLSSATTSSIRFYTPATNGWFSANTPDILTGPGKEGYMLYIRGDRTVADASSSGTTTLRPTGTLRYGHQSVPISAADTNILAGNPYASSIDLDAVYNNNGNASVIDRKFYIWDATLGTSGAYVTLIYDDIGNTYLTSLGDDGTPYLAVNSGQAFFVVGKGIDASLNIDEATKTDPSAQSLFRTMTPTGGGVSKIAVKLYQATGTIIGQQMDGAVARFNDAYNVSGTEVYDAAKFNNFNENLSLVRNGRYLSVESRPFPAQSDTLFVPFWNLKIRDYALTITSSNFAGVNQTAILIDKFTNTQKVIDLSGGTVTYPFTITSNPASSSLNRFLVVLAPSSPLAVNFTKINASPKGGKVLVSWTVGGEQGTKNYDVEKSTDGNQFTKTGTVLASNLAGGANYQWLDDKAATGNNYYRIRSNDENGSFSYSTVARVQFNGKTGIQVTPTVITNNQFTLSLNDMPAGNYKLVLRDAAGITVYQQAIENAGGNNIRQINFGKAFVAAGVYNLSIGDSKGNIQNFRLLID